MGEVAKVGVVVWEATRMGKGDGKGRGKGLGRAVWLMVGRWLSDIRWGERIAREGLVRWWLIGWGTGRERGKDDFVLFILFKLFFSAN